MSFASSNAPRTHDEATLAARRRRVLAWANLERPGTLQRVSRPMVGRPFLRHTGVLIRKLGLVVDVADDIHGPIVTPLAEFIALGPTEFGPEVSAEHGAAQRLIACHEHWGGYELWSKNCEHFANFVLHGNRVSDQVDLFLSAAAGLAVLAGGAALLTVAYAGGRDGRGAKTVKTAAGRRSKRASGRG
ncbi:MAG TPA: hypothetical protein VL860_02915 [Planctomycetota bacterium]|nr:hypothetical protein [Planctomycetota bacterium]